MYTNEQLVDMAQYCNIPKQYANKGLRDNPRFESVYKFIKEKTFKTKKGLAFFDERFDNTQEITDLFYLTARAMNLVGCPSLYVVSMTDLVDSDYYFDMDKFLQGIEYLFIDGFFDSEFPTISEDQSIKTRLAYFLTNRISSGKFTAVKVLGERKELSKGWSKRIEALVYSLCEINLTRDGIFIS